MSTNKDQKPSDKDPLREHELSKKLLKDGQPVEYLCIKGYVGKSDSDEVVRLYLNKQFNEYIQVKKNDILHAEELSEEELEFGGTCIWVRKDAELTKVKIDSEKQQARFMEGEIARAQLSPEYVSKAIERGLILVTLIYCPTDDHASVICTPQCTPQCPTRYDPFCPSQIVICTIQANCPPTTPKCPVTARCPPETPQCPSRNNPFCPTPIVICTIQANCPPTTPKCPVETDLGTDPITQLRSQLEKLKQKIKKLEEEKAE